MFRTNIYLRIVGTSQALIASAAIFFVSNLPNPHLPDLGFEWQDKLLHMIAYCIYGVSVLLAVVVNKPNLRFRRIAATVIIIGSLYAMSDELHQHFIPNRSMDFADWVADFAGINFSLVMVPLIRKIFTHPVIQERI